MPGEKISDKLCLAEADKVFVYYDSGELGKTGFEKEKTELSDEEKDSLLKYISSLTLKKHKDDYMYVSGFEQYIFDFQFTEENRRLTIDLFGGEYIKMTTFGLEYDNETFRIIKQ